MSRFVSSDNETAAEQPSICLSIAVALDFVSGAVYVCDGDHAINFGGNTYAALGKLGAVELIEESTEIISRPIKLRLSGVDSSLVATAVGDASDYQDRSITLSLCLFDPVAMVLVDTPEVLWEGRMDTMRLRLGSESAIELNCEHRLRREPRIARFTHQDQQLAYSGDRFFDLVPKIPGFRGTWGRFTLEQARADLNDRLRGGSPNLWRYIK